MPRHVRVEAATSGAVHDVDLERGTCTCDGVEKPCSHVERARDVLVEGCKRSRYALVSALHKEIRRGDVEAALYWANLIATYSDRSVARYVARIVGEETRNWALFEMALSPDATPHQELVVAIAGSRKKWEHERGYLLFTEQLRSYNRETYATAPSPAVLDELRHAIAHDDVPRLFDAWAALDAGDQQTVAVMDDILIAACERRVRGFAGRARMVIETMTDAWEARLGLVEMLAGGWDPSMNELTFSSPPRNNRAEPLVIRRFPSYVYDGHVWEGARHIAAHRGEIAPMKPMPEGIDLRWSGQIEGVAWRYAAYDQRGDGYRLALWESVEMPTEYWQMACDFQAALEEVG